MKALTTLVTASVSTIINITNIPQNYSQIRLVLTSPAAQQIYYYINGDSSANYAPVEYEVANSAVNGIAYDNQTRLRNPLNVNIAGPIATAQEMNFYLYSDGNKHTQIVGRFRYDDVDARSGHFHVRYKVSTPMTSLVIESPSFAAGTTVALFGLD